MYLSYRTEMLDGSSPASKKTKEKMARTTASRWRTWRSLHQDRAFAIETTRLLDGYLWPSVRVSGMRQDTPALK
jgi:hypothetical protein